MDAARVIGAVPTLIALAALITALVILCRKDRP